MKTPVAVLAGVLLCGPALAQAEADKPRTDVGNSGGSLSDKLSNTNGVIHPAEGLDPKMQKPAPSVGTTPVVPAPGTPGGGTDVRPK